LYEEVAYVAYHLHWPHDQILALEHRERQQWVHQVAEIVRRANDAQDAAQSELR
jgi:hypothetical protein